MWSLEWLKRSDSNLEQKCAALTRERDESLEQLTAASDILRMIARAPADLQSVLDTIAERAAKLCDAADAVVWRVDGEVRRRVAHFGQIPTGNALAAVPDRAGVIGRAIMDSQTIHVHDLQAAEAEFPRALGMALGLRTILATPLLHGGVAIGAIAIRRREVRPFSERQIKLLETFADQAVIAIENARLIREQQTRNRDLTKPWSSRPRRVKFYGLSAVHPLTYSRSSTQSCRVPRGSVMHRLVRRTASTVSL